MIDFIKQYNKTQNPMYLKLSKFKKDYQRLEYLNDLYCNAGACLYNKDRLRLKRFYNRVFKIITRYSDNKIKGVTA